MEIPPDEKEMFKGFDISGEDGDEYDPEDVDEEDLDQSNLDYRHSTPIDENYDSSKYPKKDAKWRVTMSRFATAVLIKQCREFEDWDEDLYYECEKDEGDPEELEDDDYCLIHEDYTVTKGVNVDLSKIWPIEKVTPEWIKFCDEVIKIGKWS